jgi:predicted HicB family RNase H-like nuclease
MNYPRKGRKRLAIDIPDHTHEAIKKFAKRRNISMQVWVMRALVRSLIEEGCAFKAHPLVIKE